MFDSIRYKLTSSIFRFVSLLLSSHVHPGQQYWLSVEVLLQILSSFRGVCFVSHSYVVLVHLYDCYFWIRSHRSSSVRLTCGYMLLGVQFSSLIHMRS